MKVTVAYIEVLAQYMHGWTEYNPESPVKVASFWPQDSKLGLLKYECFFLINNLYVKILSL
jgi:hypothetical protein